MATAPAAVSTRVAGLKLRGQLCARLRRGRRRRRGVDRSSGTVENRGKSGEIRRLTSADGSALTRRSGRSRSLVGSHVISHFIVCPARPEQTLNLRPSSASKRGQGELRKLRLPCQECAARQGGARVRQRSKVSRG
jgi:hypothetical protein